MIKMILHNNSIKDASLKDIALAELVSYNFETQRNSTKSVVFRLPNLVSMYEERHSQLCLTSLPVHTTRLKDKLLNKIPGSQTPIYPFSTRTLYRNHEPCPIIFTSGSKGDGMLD
jgi:hypothetical protein